MWVGGKCKLYLNFVVNHAMFEKMSALLVPESKIKFEGVYLLLRHPVPSRMNLNKTA